MTLLTENGYGPPTPYQCRKESATNSRWKYAYSDSRFPLRSSRDVIKGLNILKLTGNPDSADDTDSSAFLMEEKNQVTW